MGILEVPLQSIKTQRDLLTKLKHFYASPTAVLLIRVIGRTEHTYLYYLQYLLADFQEEFRHLSKKVVITVHHKPDSMGSSPVFPVNGKWSIRFFDNLFSGLTEDTRKLITQFDLPTAIESSLPLATDNFDSLIDKCFVDRSTSRTNTDALLFINTFFSNFTTKYGPSIVQIILASLHKAILACPRLANCKTIFDLLNQRTSPHHGLIASYDLPKRINECLLDLWQSKLQELLKILEGDMLIYSLKAFTTSQSKPLLTLWTTIFKRYMTPVRVNSLKQPYPLHLPLRFPLSHLEYSALSLQRTEMDQLKGPNELKRHEATVPFVHDLFPTFQDTSIYSNNPRHLCLRPPSLPTPTPPRRPRLPPSPSHD